MILRSLACAGLLAASASAQLMTVFVPPENPLTPEKIVLGKILFWDEQLSSDDSMACGTCHLPEFGGTDGRTTPAVNPGPDGLFGTADDIRGSHGVARQAANGDFAWSPTYGAKRQVTGRNSMTTMGAAWATDLFWDGRALQEFDDPETGLLLIPYGGGLESQAVGPILSNTEMARVGRTWQDVRSKLQSVTPLRLATNLPADLQAALQQFPTYPALFTNAFGDPAITAARIAYAIASYERTLIPDDTPWDRYMAGQLNAMTSAEKAGWTSFQNNGRCRSCHTDPTFQDDQFHNLGLRFAAEDIGRGANSSSPFDLAAFKTPTLRNAGLRARLFHNGQSPALGDPAQWTDPNSVLNVYWNGHGVDPSNLDPFLVPLNLLGVTQAEVASVLDFVRTALTDARAANRLPPFDHPDLRSAVQAPPRSFGPVLAGASVPLLIDTVPTFPGNTDWKLGLVGGDGATPALLTYGFSSIEPCAWVLGMPWHLNVSGWQLFALQGPSGQPGLATWRLPIPNDPSLGAVPFYFQLFAADPAAPGGIATSSGTEFFVR